MTILILILILYGAFPGLLIATFLLIAGWFAWTPLPLVFRIPVGIVLLAPFGLIASAIIHEPQLAVTVAGVTWVCVVTGFAADRSAAFTFCLVVLFLFCIVPLLGGIFLHPAMTDQIHGSMFGFTIVVMLNLALLCVPLRLLGFRLERLAFDAGDHGTRLASEKSIDEWIIELRKSDQDEASFAEIVHFVKHRGVTTETAQSVAKAVCRALGKPAPRLAVTRADGGLSSWLQWATSGPRREQYSVRQLMLWVVACSILFAILSRTGIDRDAMLGWFALNYWLMHLRREGFRLIRSYPRAR